MKKSKHTRLTAMMFAAAVGAALTGCHDAEPQDVYGPPPFSEADPMQPEYGAPEIETAAPETIPTEEITTEEITTEELTAALTEETSRSEKLYQCVYGPPPMAPDTEPTEIYGPPEDAPAD